MDFSNLASVLTPAELRAMATAMEKLTRANVAAPVTTEATTSAAPPVPTNVPLSVDVPPTDEAIEAAIVDVIQSIPAEPDQTQKSQSGEQGDKALAEVDKAQATVDTDVDVGIEGKGTSEEIPEGEKNVTIPDDIDDHYSRMIDDYAEKEISHDSQATGISRGRRMSTRIKGKGAASGTVPSSKRKAESTSSDGRQVRSKTENLIRRDAPKEFPKSSDKSCPGIVRDLAFDPDFLIKNKLGEVVDFITCQGWDELFVGPAMVDISLIKDFYRSFELVSSDKVLTVRFKIGEESFQLTEKVLATILGVSVVGYEDFCGGIPLDVTEGEVHDVVFGKGDNMPVVSRVLLEYLALCFVPRGGKHTVPTTYEEVLI